MKNALIVGASSGIGQKLAHILSNNGDAVFGTYFNHPQESSSQNITYHYLNVLDSEFSLEFLPDTLDGLVYCPGLINLKPFHRTKPEEYLADYNTQVIGAIKVIQAALPKLKKGKDPSIVLFSTVAVQTGYNFHSLVASSKGAIEGLTRSLAAEFAPTIRVNCIAPSLTDTPLASKLLNTDAKKEANENRHPLKRIGQSEDLAQMASFLLSEKASWITGQVMKVDGGMSSINL